ncbi:zinc-binding dehydrogenase [Hirschia baltica]|uniref:Alcohol dehydrogenase zinc-binding domain protein n=1 Tax=Hirschia baltica (strain ATCC 49814 / DSM 5838 / IFAM 1418) TaxID=582402 RepID=C6XJ94_HIRBI|nr:zinc-binding dehydrogenase [Hirschia baltica]ACT59189.1 Alcohol dehydrogenase zinc-binding domain protein [Hirschia baltica ATCC 49814]
MNTNYTAIQLQKFASTFREASKIVSQELRDPDLGEVKVRNLYCGINGIFDTQIARNAVDYVSVQLPTLTGVEALGVVEACGEGVVGLSEGDAVVTTRFPSGYRQWNTAPASYFVKVPDTRPEWLVLASTGVSAYVALKQTGALANGETVAISAAAGGLGHLLVQIAKLHDCRIVGVCGGQTKGEFVRGLGADRVIDYKTESVADVLGTEFKDGLDVAVDTVSGSIFDAFLDNIAVHGRLVVGGAAQDLEGEPEIVTAPRIANKLYYKGASVRGFMNGLLTDHWPDARTWLFERFAAGDIKVTFDEPQFKGLNGVYDAVDRLLSGRSMGKVVVDLS